MAGSHICEPLLLARHSHSSRVAGTSAVGCFAEIESVTSVWRPERLARGPPAREVRRLEDVPIVPSFRAATQAQKLSLLKMQSVGNPAGYFWRRRKLVFAVRSSPFAFRRSLLALGGIANPIDASLVPFFFDRCDDGFRTFNKPVPKNEDCGTQLQKQAILPSKAKPLTQYNQEQGSPKPP
jgi:hypothetical protein